MNDRKTPPLSRRRFLAQGALAASAVGLGLARSAAAENSGEPRFRLIGFTKPFQKLGAEETAEFVAHVGWDGIECPVRSKGQIEPEHAPDKLPEFAEALRRRQSDIYLLATDIVSIAEPHVETVLRTMATVGIKRLRLGHFLYPSDKSPADRLKEIGPALKDIAQACGELGLQAGFQNHSGARYVGAPVWDVYSLIRDLNPRDIGFCFDIGHATAEGGLSWPVQARLAEPFLSAVLVKDFYWKRETSGWEQTWCPLGEGMVNRRFFAWLKTTSYHGPIGLQHEYELGDAKQMAARMRHDLDTLKSWVA